MFTHTKSSHVVNTCAFETHNVFNMLNSLRINHEYRPTM